MKLLLPLILMSGLLVAADKPKETAAADHKKLQGTWHAREESHGDAERNDDAKHYQLIFDGDKFSIKKDDQTIVEGTFRIDPAKSPPQIDMKVLREDENHHTGETSLGIYQINGDTLKWCSGEPGQTDRPTGFDTKGTDFMMVVLEREKK